MEVEPVGLYVHVPFCQRKCAYCDFNSYVGMEEVWPTYLETLVGEIVAMPPLRPRTLYVGGGTPTLWPAEYLTSLIGAARAVGLPDEAEATVEANPGTVDSWSLGRLRDAGYNRISIGVQSTVDANLRMLGRMHAVAEAATAVRWAREAGFDNVSIDLIYGLPGQSPEAWRSDLRRALEWESQHLSAYALSVEEGTPLAAAMVRRQLPRPDDDAVADMYELATDELDQARFVQYEISNWARAVPGARVTADQGRVTADQGRVTADQGRSADRSGRCDGGTDRQGPQEVLLTSEHNLIYWRNEPYLGLGAGAHSCLGGRRFARIGDPREYVRASPAARVGFSESIGRPLAMAEAAMLALRLTRGLSRSCFEHRFGADPLALYGDVFRRMSRCGLVEVAGDRIGLTRRGRILSNEVFQLLLPD